MVAEPAREAGDPRRVVKFREQTRSGEVPDHQEDRAEKKNQSPKRRSPRRRSPRRPSTSGFQQNQYTDKVVDVTDDDRHDEQSRSDTIKTNSKIVTEQIWINPVTSKIVSQPLEPDTDAQLHEERKSREVRLSRSTREMSQVECGLEEFQEEIKVAQKTAVTPQVQR